MHINPISFNNFKARLTRNNKHTSGEDGNSYDKSTTKKELVASYNNQIKEMRKQRENALEFDTFMHSEPIKKCLRRFPEKDEIEIVNKFSYLDVDENDKTTFDPMFLMYKFKDPKSIKMLERAKRMGADMEDKLSMCYVQREDGTIDKGKISKYLVDIADFLEVRE